MKLFIITCQLPGPTGNVYEENYFCGFITLPTGFVAVEWDTDDAFAKIFPSKVAAKKILQVLDQEAVVKEIDFKPLKKSK